MMSSLKEVNKLLYNIILYVCISSVWLWAIYYILDQGWYNIM
jgi:ABC-type multidrug transport system permease subunit